LADAVVDPGAVMVHLEDAEILVVALADAVVDPRAVMVHLEDAEATFLAMMGPDWLPSRRSYALLAVFDLHVL